MKKYSFLSPFIFIILLGLFFVFNSNTKISTSLTSIIPKGENKELLNKFNEFKNNKKLLIAVKGTDEKALQNIRKIENTLLQNQFITKVIENKTKERYKKQTYYFQNTLDTKKIENLDIQKEVNLLYEKLLSDPFSFQVNLQDPLSLFVKQTNQKLQFQNGYVVLDGYGYFSVLNIDSNINSIDAYKKIYEYVHTNITIEEDTKIFSPIFYFVENSQIIKEDVNTLIILSSFLLLLLYGYLLKNIKLLFHTLVALGIAVLIASMVVTFIFDEVSIFVFVFGISISTVAIDYMFHHYMLGYYSKNKGFNKDVFIGMITTIGAFFILSLSSFALIQQLSIFAIVSLFSSFVLFSFLFPKIGFTLNNTNESKTIFTYRIKPIYIFIFALLIGIASLFKIDFDTNIKNLDVKNEKLDSLNSFFNTYLNENKVSVLLLAKNQEELISYANTIKKEFPTSYVPLAILKDKQTYQKDLEQLQKYNFKKINTQLQKLSEQKGFKEGYFSSSYNLDTNIYDTNHLDLDEFDVLKYKKNYLTYVSVDKKDFDKAVAYPYVKAINLKYLFEKEFSQNITNLVYGGVFILLYLVLVLFYFRRENLVVSLNYIIFPIAIILLLAFFMSLNILHLFMMFVIISIGIDFGVYMGAKEISKNAKLAINYSLVSTFAGFGVLVFSNMKALNSIGLVATIGIVAILILLYNSKKDTDANYNL